MLITKMCKGQQVIHHITRKSHIVKELNIESGLFSTEDGLTIASSFVTPIEKYLDRSSYYYHHSKVISLNDCPEFDNYLFYYNENSEYNTEYNTKKLNAAMKKLEKRLAIHRTALYNLNQWFNEELDSHKTFLNPENIKDY